jgi:dUTP pyrophosphatase
MIVVKALSDLPMPKRQTEGAAGYDLQSDKDFVIHSMQRVLVPTGYAFEIPRGNVGLIEDRSSMAYKYGISTLAGVIDSDYRGEVKVLLINLGAMTYKVSKGDRIAQMIIIPHRSDELVLVDELDDFDREGGFGSTGK